MNSFLDPVEFSLASKWIRFANFIIDYIFFIILYFFFRTYFSTLLGFIYWGNDFAQIFIDSFIYFSFMMIQEFVFKGRTIAKFITGTKVVTIDGQEPDFTNCIVRALSRCVPFEPISFFGEIGWHDAWSKTRVVNAKEFKMNQSKFNAIDQIGVNS